MKVILEFENSHHYQRDFEKSDYFCPQCGTKSVWVECGSGDYYVGASYYCTSCIVEFHLPSETVPLDKARSGIVEQLLSGIAKTPTTPKGT